MSLPLITHWFGPPPGADDQGVRERPSRDVLRVVPTTPLPVTSDADTSDAQLATRIRNGDVTAFGQLYTRTPFFFMNRVEAIGPTGRVALGYTPPNRSTYEAYSDWPRRPIIVPSMMVHDFNFSALADAI
jgi:hypothetical protein